jgi:hypothetical protein
MPEWVRDNRTAEEHFEAWWEAVEAPEAAKVLYKDIARIAFLAGVKLPGKMGWGVAFA